MEESEVRRGGAEGVTVSSKVSVSPPAPSSHPDTSSLFLTRYWRASLRKRPQKRKEKTRTRAATMRRESGKPEETRGPPGTDDRVVLMFKIIDDGGGGASSPSMVIIQRINRKTKDCLTTIFHLVSPGLTPGLTWSFTWSDTWSFTWSHLV